MHRGHRLDEPIQFRRRDPLRSRLRNLVDRLEETRGALAGRRRQVQHGRVVEELQLLVQLVVELLDELRAASLHQVPFVHRDDDPGARLVRLAGDRGVLIARAFDRIDD